VAEPDVVVGAVTAAPSDRRACTGCGRVVALRSGRCASCRAAADARQCAGCGMVRPTQRRVEAGVLCAKCCGRADRAVEVARIRASLIDTLEFLGVDPGAAGEAFDAVVGRRDVALLGAALRDDTALFTGSTTAPPVVDRIAAHLDANAAGLTSMVVVAACAICRVARRTGARVGGERVCTSCAGAARAHRCSSCTVLVVRHRYPEGPILCASCRVAQRIEDRRAARTGLCSRCGRERPLVQRQRDPQARVCADCVPPPIVDCVICGQRRPGFSGARTGRARCFACVARRETCSVCHSPNRTVAARWASGPVCAACRPRLLAQRSICGGCGETRRIDPRNTNGLALCSTCAGLKPLAVCVGCEREDRIYRHGRCFGCVLDVRLDELLAGSDRLEPLRAALRDSPSPRTVLRWLDSKIIAATIRAMSSGAAPLSHATLDTAGPQAAVSHLRAVLVESGLLEARDEQVARLEVFIDAQLRLVERPDDRKALDAFARWHVLRRHRQRMARADPRRGRVDAKDARNDVRYAVRFLVWLHDHDVTLAECTQRHVDEWVTSGPPSRILARDFVRWAVKRRLANGIDVASPRDQLPARSMTTDDLIALVRRFLDDDEIHAATRVAGLFVMCFGQPLTRIVALRRDEIVRRDGQDWVQFGGTPIELPEPIAVVVRDLLVDEAKGHATTGASGASDWLFPGGRPGRPMSPAALELRLHRYGIYAKATRTAALLDLASELPPAVLADMIGLFKNTAVRWVHAAGGDWTTYAADKARETRPPIHSDDVDTTR
jgi:hypothetical protein